jgi:L-alanine-DL-glutamate epimerase-like enolase superfamily enzyme
MGPISRAEIIAIGPTMPPIQYTSLAPSAFATMTVVKVTDQDGSVGIASYDSDSYDHFDLVPLESLRPLAAHVVGKDPKVRSGVGVTLRSLLPSSVSAPGPASAFDTALWDLAAKNAGLPLCQMLGGMRDEIPGYASLPLAESLDACLEQVSDAHAAGFEAVKLHVSGNPSLDAATAVRVRESFTGIDIMLDAEGTYDRRGAAYVGAALQDIHARWFEAPLPDQDLAGYRKLRNALTIPILPAGDCIWDLRTLTEILRDPPWDAVRSAASLGGGISYGCQLAGLVSGFGVDVELSTYGFGLTQAANLHLMLGLGIGSFFEQPFPSEPWAFGLADAFPFGYGRTYRSPDKPGLGIVLNDEEIDSAAIERFIVE